MSAKRRDLYRILQDPYVMAVASIGSCNMRYGT